MYDEENREISYRVMRMNPFGLKTPPPPKKKKKKKNMETATAPDPHILPLMTEIFLKNTKYIDSYPMNSRPYLNPPSSH
jgi:hypothetical protein